MTLPTSTPAIRTGDFGFRLFTSLKTALNSYGLANGFAFEKPKYVNRPTTTSARTPARKGLMPF